MTRILLFLIALSLGCERTPSPTTLPTEAGREVIEVTEKDALAKESDTFRFLAPNRLVAFADVHGDLEALVGVLRATQLIDENKEWIGGDTFLVQTGDLLDRGPDERAVVDLMLALAKQAEAAGGAIIQLNGNHEIMNVMGDLRYIPPKGFSDFQDVPGEVKDVPESVRGRIAAFLPGGPYARALATHGVIAAVNDSLFAHGGVSMNEVRYGIDRLNDETIRWMKGELATPPGLLTDSNGPIWIRKFSEPEPSPAACSELKEVLDTLKLKRLVVGHTVQKEGVTHACDQRVWRIDTGMSAHYGGGGHALEIGADVNVVSVP